MFYQPKFQPALNHGLGSTVTDVKEDLDESSNLPLPADLDNNAFFWLHALLSTSTRQRVILTLAFVKQAW